MKSRFACYVGGVLVGSMWMTGAPSFAADEMKPADGDKPVLKKADKQKPPKIYRYRGEKKGNLGDGRQTMVLTLEDVSGGKSEAVYVATNSPDSREYDPLTAVADTVKALAVGDLVEIETERQKGRTVATAVKKADVQPGEERPTVFVLVDWDKQPQGDGKRLMAVKLKKFGREITAMVPLTKSAGQSNDWYAPDSVEYVLQRLEKGKLVEAFFTSTNPPVLRDMYIYRPPEQGKFVEFTQKEMDNGTVAAAFKFLAKDGVTITITLPGVPKSSGKTKVLAPDPAQLRAVQRIKPDSEVEVTLEPSDNGMRYVLRDIKVLSAPGPASKDSKDKSKKNG